MRYSLFICLAILGRFAQAGDASPAIVSPQTMTLSVDHMMCSSCTSRVKKSLQSHPGVGDITVNLSDHEARFSCEASKGCDREKILKDLSRIGYPAKVRETK